MMGTGRFHISTALDTVSKIRPEQIITYRMISYVSPAMKNYSRIF